MADSARPDIPHPNPETPPPSNDALSALFQAGAADVQQPDLSLLAQCDVPGDNRRKNVQTKLADIDDPSTKIGRNLIDRLTKHGQLDETFLADLAANGGQAIADTLSTPSAAEGINTETVASLLSGQIKALSSGDGDIFTDVPPEKKTNDEGKRLAEGEKTLVLAKAALLELAADEAVTPATLAIAVEHMSQSNVFAIEYPDWFVQGLESAVRTYDIAKMTQADLPVLRTLSENMWHLTNTTSSAAEEAKNATSPDDLSGLKYVYRRCLDAAKQIKIIEEERIRAEEEAKHQKELAEYQSQTFSDQTQKVQDQVTEHLKSSRNISLEGHELLRKVLPFDRQRWTQYLDSQRSIDSMLTSLSSFTDDAFLNRVSADFANERSSNYQYNDGTYMGTLAAMSPEAAQAAVRGNIERELYASAFGFIRAAFENSPPWRKEHLDKQRLNWATQALTAVAKGKAVKLLSAVTPEEQSAFSPAQLQFRSALLSYLTEMQGRDSTKATALGNAIRIGAVSADREVARIQARKEERLREAAEKRVAAQTAAEQLQSSKQQIGAKFAELETVESLLSRREETTAIILVGSGEQRRLGINTAERDKLVTERQALEEQLKTSPDPQERAGIVERLATTNTILRFFTEVETRLKQLDGAVFIAKDGTLIKRNVACYNADAFPDLDRLKKPDLRLSQFSSLQEDRYSKDTVPARIKAIEERLAALRQKDPVESMGEADQIVRDIESLGREMTMQFGQIDQLVTRAIGYVVNDIFSRTGDLWIRSNNKKDPFNLIIRRR